MMDLWRLSFLRGIFVVYSFLCSGHSGVRTKIANNSNSVEHANPHLSEIVAARLDTDSVNRYKRTLMYHIHIIFFYRGGEIKMFVAEH